MADTVDHDDLAEQVAGAPKDWNELSAAEWRAKMLEVTHRTEANLAHIAYLVRKGAELAALQALALERNRMATLMREVRQ